MLHFALVKFAIMYVGTIKVEILGLMITSDEK